jgi:hypothetical protein
MLAVLLVVVLVVVLLSCCCRCLHLLCCHVANTAAAATVGTLPPLPLRWSAWKLMPATQTPTAAPPRWRTPSAGPQPKVGGSEGGEVGETARWTITKGWDVILSFGGSRERRGGAIRLF